MAKIAPLLALTTSVASVVADLPPCSESDAGCHDSRLPVLWNKDVVEFFSLADGDVGVDGVEDYQAVYNGYTFYFKDADNQALFEASPEKYAPRCGGFCALAVGCHGDKSGCDVADQGPVFVDDGSGWLIHNSSVTGEEALYMFNHGAKDMVLENREPSGTWTSADDFLAFAEANWLNWFPSEDEYNTDAVWPFQDDDGEDNCRSCDLDLETALVTPDAPFHAPKGKLPCLTEATGNCTSADIPAAFGWDVVEFFTTLEDGDMPVNGTSSFVASHQGYDFWFTSEANKEAFASDPWKYAPAWGGFCSYGVAVETQWSEDYLGPPVILTGDGWAIQNDRLLFFNGPAAKSMWYSNDDDGPDGLFDKSQAAWESWYGGELNAGPFNTDASYPFDYCRSCS